MNVNDGCNTLFALVLYFGLTNLNFFIFYRNIVKSIYWNLLWFIIFAFVWKYCQIWNLHASTWASLQMIDRGRFSAQALKISSSPELNFKEFPKFQHFNIFKEFLRFFLISTFSKHINSKTMAHYLFHFYFDKNSTLLVCCIISIFSRSLCPQVVQ